MRRRPRGRPSRGPIQPAVPAYAASIPGAGIPEDQGGVCPPCDHGSMQQEASLPFEPPRHRAEQQLSDRSAAIIEIGAHPEAGIVNPGDPPEIMRSSRSSIHVVGPSLSIDRRRRPVPTQPDRDTVLDRDLDERDIWWQLAEELLESRKILVGVGFERQRCIA